MQIDATTHRSPNHEPRHEAVSALVLHTGEGTRSSDIATLCLPNGLKSVSAHYYVCRDATVYQLVSDDQVAWHAGISHYAGRASWNGFSLGIETEHKKGQDWPVAQWDAIRELCYELITRYAIHRDRRAAHRWIAPTRKYDPSDRDNDFLFSFFSAFGHDDTTNWRTYRCLVDIARVRSEPDVAAPIARKMRRDALGNGTPVLGASVGGNKTWIAWRYGGYTHSSLVGVI